MHDWNSEDWDPAEERRAAVKKARSVVGDWDSAQALLSTEWQLFEARMTAWARRRFDDTGVNVPDSELVAHRRRFKRLLEERYGSSELDAEWLAKTKPVDDEERARRFTTRAHREFFGARSGPPSSVAIAAIDLAREQMRGMR